MSLDTRIRPTALVTGAAAGIGRATARRFAAEGFLVGAYDVDEAALAALADELGDSVVTGHLDVRDPVQWRRVLADLTGRGSGRLDVLVNNAGILQSGRFDEIDLEAQQRTVQVNITGVLNGCHTAYPYLKATPEAHVVNLASASAIYGQPGLATYSATKFAVRGLTEALDLEWAQDDITVRAVWPLFVKTAMVDGMAIGAVRSLGVRLSPEDVAEAVFTATRPGSRRSPHRAVGRQARLMLASSSLTPTWLLRATNRKIARL